MFVSHKELLWMLRQVYGQRAKAETLIRKFSNHGISSLFPYFNDIESFFDKSSDKLGVLANVVRALEARTHHEIDFPSDDFGDMSFRNIESNLTPILIHFFNLEKFSTLEKGARVSVRLDSGASNVPPGSEGFITEKFSDVSKVRFYSSAGRYRIDMFSTDVSDKDLQTLNVDKLLDRHHDLSGIAQYFFNDSMLRVMRSTLDSTVHSFAANLALKFLVDEGFIKIEGDEFIGEPDRILSVLAPRLDETYKNARLFSSQSLSSPPSERKPHVLRLELTTGCDYNRCTFCSEYSDFVPATKPFDEFREHVDRVVDSIGSEKSKIKRLFIGSGNSLGVDSELLRESLSYASDVFDPQRISLYGRTSSILEKSVDELKRLKAAGLSLIYWGLESGSDEVLSYICKDCTRTEMIEASKKLVAAGIETSAMLMPGVGGLKLSKEHVAGTLELLHQVDLRYLTLLSINPCVTSLYARNISSEIDNRPLTPDEVNAQVYKLLEGLNPSGLQIGMFTEEIDQASSNTMRFNYQFTDSNKELLLRDFWK